MGSLQDRAASTGKSMQRAGRAMTVGVTAPLAAMGAMSVRVAGNFDQAMQRSIAVMGDVDAALAKVEAGERYRGAWWRRIVKPGLETFDDVEKPARGASEWQYTGDR